MLKIATLGRVAALSLGVALLGAAAAEAAPNCARPQADQVSAMVRMVNAERAARGLRPLALSNRLNAAAQGHACDMAQKGYFSHRSASGTLPKARIRAAGCRTRLSAENIAMGYRSAETTNSVWMNSSGHKRNILLRGVDSAGVGLAPGAQGPIWVLVLASGC